MLTVFYNTAQQVEWYLEKIFAVYCERHIKFTNILKRKFWF